MKRLLALLIVLSLLSCMLASCNKGGGGEEPDGNPSGDVGGGTEGEGDGDDGGEETGGEGDKAPAIPEGLTGIDVIKLLLAGERLGGKLIDGDDGFFAEGAETYATLAARAEANLGVQMLTFDASAVRSLEGAIRTELLSSGSEFTEFDEVSRNYEMFEEMTGLIVGEATRASSVIDYVKKHVKILDTWVLKSYGGYEDVYLHVEENSETIITRSADRVTVCHRYKNELGEDVYELYDQNSFEVIRSSYIAGRKYELMHRMNGERYQGMSANNEKGYWEVFDVVYDPQWVEYQFDTNFIIMKDDICYRAGYSMREGSGVNYTITSPNRASDIVLISESDGGSFFDISLGSFEGYYGVVDVQPGNLGKLKLADGRLIDTESVIDVGHDGYVAAINSVVATESAFGKEGSVMISIYGPDAAKKRIIFTEILADWGLTCKYDLSAIFAMVDRADEEFINMRKYLRWNGNDVNSIEGLLAGVDVEKAKFKAMSDIYDGAKSAPGVERNSKESELLMSFAPISEISADGTSAAGAVLTVGKLSVSTEDMLLFVKGEKYKAALALKSHSSGGLVHLYADTPAEEYMGESSITLSAEGLEIELPVLAPGEYTLVVYISTEDGIRSSAYTELPFEEADGVTVKSGNIEIVASVTDGVLKVTYTETADAMATFSLAATVDYATLYDLMAETVFSYGIPSDALIERIDEESGEAVALTGEETEIEDGRYRMAYTAVNGETERAGYIYVEVKVEPEIPDIESVPDADIGTETEGDNTESDIGAEQ